MVEKRLDILAHFDGPEAGRGPESSSSFHNGRVYS